MKTRATTILTVLLVAVLGPAKLAAHGEATLESPSSSVAAGGSLTLNGAGFAPGQVHRLVLRGSLEEHELGGVTPEADSTFTAQLSIPADARPGQFRLVAVAPDGDEVATLEMPVRAAERTSGASEGGHGEVASGSPASSAPRARADEIRIERSRAGLEWGVIGLLIGLSGGLGAALLKRA